MITCKNLNINLCAWCYKQDEYNCVIKSWNKWFPQETDIKIIKDLLQRNLYGKEYFFYGAEALKYYNIKLYDKLNNLIILQ
jgi:hypothetical protein